MIDDIDEPLMAFQRRKALATLAGAALLPMARGSRAAVADVPLDSAVFEQVSDRARSLQQLHSLIIRQHGGTLLAEALRGPPVDQPVNIKSVSKTLVATLTGIALDRGEFDSVDRTLGELVPELIPKQATEGVSDISIANLLGMQAGLERTSGPYYNTWVNSDNWIDHVLTRPFVAEPGSRMLYSTGSYHVLGAVLTRLTGKALPSLARQWLGRPLGIEFPGWTKDPQGYYLGGNEMSLSPEALADLGEVFRLGGRWNGRSVISQDWIEAAWTPSTRSPWSGHDYGYGWFLTRLQGEQVAYARGYGGQLVYVMPSKALTVVITSDINTPARSGGYIDELHELFANVIVPAVEPADQ